MRIIDVIDHVNVMDDEFVYREPQQGSGDWRFGSQVIVGESQSAVFVRGGQALDELKTGRHTLSVANLPILSGLIGLATSGRTPFTADLYFINLKDLPQVGWGTNPPIPIELPGTAMGAALLTTFGTMNLRISDPMRFLKKFAVGKPITRLEHIRDALQTKLLGEITVLLMGAGIKSVMDANKLLSDLEGAALAKLSGQFEDEFGVSITSLDANPFQAKQVSVDEMMSYMSAETYERVVKVQALRDAAKNPGGIAGAGVGLGVGQAIGSMMMSPEQQAAQQSAQQQQQMMQQMMMQQMMQMMNQQQQATPQASAPAATSAAPQTVAEVQAAMDALDMRLINGEIKQEVYDRLYAKLEAKLKELGG